LTHGDLTEPSALPTILRATGVGNVVTYFLRFFFDVPGMPQWMAAQL
jgi:hypothetical protein